ncbi:MAG: SLC13 family permease [Cephaloticoccus sp.]|nr:SLC13 family permease [Cephaloticoccus sp.]MCF7759165.1 SLC13 family permease [Cephaloticoccus sp.]
MTWDIALVFILLVLTLACFMWEKFPPDLTALTLFLILVGTQLIPSGMAFSVFSNPAPLTVGAMFILSAALVKCGAVDRISALIESTSKLPYSVVILLMVVMVSTLSAFINNTPVVVVFLPVILNLARKMNRAPSKLLIPLSYAAVLGGTCTLIGTSTNLVVNGIITAKGLPAFSMFELGWLGVPVTILGGIYLAIFGNRLLPVREMLTSILSDEERREYITEAYVQDSSPVLGKTLAEAGLTQKRGVRVIEIVRDGIALHLEAKNVELKPGDRLILSCRPTGIANTRRLEGVNLVSELNLGIEQIAAHEGSLVEAVVTPHSALLGHTVSDVNFRQRYRMVVVALHRKGKNVREQIESLPIEAGDVLLMMGTDQAIDALRNNDDFLFFDRARVPTKPQTGKMLLVAGVIAAVVTAAALEWVPIEIGALTGCVIVCLARVLKTTEAYAAVDWNILFLIYGMLAMGMAMEHTGAAAWIAGHVVTGVQYLVPAAHKGIVMLACLYLVTTVLTEILSNNAVAALMAPIAIGVAIKLGMDPRPFIIAVAFGASAAFATPIGYQTNTYVYGVGGYRFSDFLKIGVPLNILCFVVAMVVIPRVWPF